MNLMNLKEALPDPESRLARYVAVVAAASLVPLLVWQVATRRVFDADGFMPHGHCYLWQEGLVWLHFSSDALIGASYVAISATLGYLVTRARRELPFHWMLIAFGLFIVACAATHFMEVWTLWTPVYWLAGDVKAVTAVASVATAIALPPLVPRVLALIQDAKASGRRKVELEAAHIELEGLLARVRELDELKTQFFANVSHELRTPLTLMLGPTRKLLAAGELAPEQRHDLQVVDRNARILLKHVNDLLDISKLEAGRMGLRYEHDDLAQLVRLTASYFEGLARDRRILLTVETPAAMPGQYDPEKIQRVLLNLLSNAFKFAPDGGRVRCELKSAIRTVPGAPAAAAILTVGDDGPGVSPELREAIFERFRQVDGGSTRSAGGTGLGLSIAREIVHLHAGTISVSEAPGGGALFTVELSLAAPAGAEIHAPSGSPDAGSEPGLPIVEALKAARLPVSEVEPAAPAGSAGTGADLAPRGIVAVPGEPAAGNGAPATPLVLVVEDNPDMNRFVVESLGGEYRVERAFDGGEGLEKALALRPDLILSDVMMPRVSGDQLVREVRGHPELDGVPVVLLTAKADDLLRVTLLREGAQDYLMKPFAVEELRARVGNLVAVKRARETLQRQLASTEEDVAELSEEAARRNHDLAQALESLRASQAEREELLAREQEARAEAERASRAKDEFLATVSHELRTPLQAVLGWARLLRSGRVDEQTTARALETIERNARSQAQLVEDILDVSRIITGRLRLDVSTVGLPRVVELAVGSLALAAETKGIHLECELERDVGAVVGDANRLQQIVWNLVSNAVKFTPRGGRVRVELRRVENAQVEIAVSDDGIGIGPEFLPHVFDRFRQADATATRVHGGLGLGLAIVRHLVEAHGGTVDVASRGVGERSRFAVRLPIAFRAEGGRDRRQETHPSSFAVQPAAAELAGLRIIVVDDEADAREVIKAVLERSGASVTAVGSCAEALDALERTAPDVLVSDLGMPGEDGFALIRKVRERERGHGQRVAALALTAYARFDDRARALSAGYQRHLAKPVAPEDLVAAVESLTRRVGAGDPGPARA